MKKVVWILCILALVYTLMGGCKPTERRLEMPRGQPDYGLYTQTPAASGIADPGEAAARLGSINIYDRRGWTVWMDDFEAPRLKWPTGRNVGGTLPVLSTAYAWMGSQSVYFVTAAAGGTYAFISLVFPLLRLGRVGIEFFIYLENKTPGYMRTQVKLYDGANVSQAELRLDKEARTATLVTSTGYPVVATNCFNTGPLGWWMPVKLVVDMDTDRYVRLLIGPTEYDLSAHALVPGAGTAQRGIIVEHRLVGDDINAMYAYMDNFILTQNEP